MIFKLARTEKENLREDIISDVAVYDSYKSNPDFDDEKLYALYKILKEINSYVEVQAEEISKFIKNTNSILRNKINSLYKSWCSQRCSQVGMPNQVGMEKYSLFEIKLKQTEDWINDEIINLNPLQKVKDYLISNYIKYWNASYFVILLKLKSNNINDDFLSRISELKSLIKKEYSDIKLKLQKLQNHVEYMVENCKITKNDEHSTNTMYSINVPTTDFYLQYTYIGFSIEVNFLPHSDSPLKVDDKLVKEISILYKELPEEFSLMSIERLHRDDDENLLKQYIDNLKRTIDFLSYLKSNNLYSKYLDLIKEGSTSKSKNSAKTIISYLSNDSILNELKVLIKAKGLEKALIATKLFSITPLSHNGFYPKDEDGSPIITDEELSEDEKDSFYGTYSVRDRNLNGIYLDSSDTRKFVYDSIVNELKLNNIDHNKARLILNGLKKLLVIEAFNLSNKDTLNVFSFMLRFIKDKDSNFILKQFKDLVYLTDHIPLEVIKNLNESIADHIFMPFNDLDSFIKKLNNCKSVYAILHMFMQYYIMYHLTKLFMVIYVNLYLIKKSTQIMI